MEDKLLHLNIQLGQAEQTHQQPESRTFLENVLSDDLIFRRASKAIVTRQEYLDGLSKATYERVDTQVMEVKISSNGNYAVVTCLVTAKGVGRNGPFEGTYKNIRFWRRSEASVVGWLLYGWYNEDML